MRSSIPSDLKPDQVTAIVDTREQLFLNLTPLHVEVATLATGDYSVKGLVDVVAIERKSLSNLLGCIGGERERFDREVQRLLAYPVRALVVEATWGEIEAGGRRSQVTPAAAVGSLLGWIAAGLPHGLSSPSRGAAICFCRRHSPRVGGLPKHIEPRSGGTHAMREGRTILVPPLRG
jgi:DNA excision repair protein ERCC-4